MIIDCSQKLLDLDGNDMGELREAIKMACTRELPGDENLTGQTKFDLYQIALKSKLDTCNFTVEEISIIKARVGKAYPPAIVGPVFMLIDPKE